MKKIITHSKKKTTVVAICIGALFLAVYLLTQKNEKLSNSCVEIVISHNTYNLGVGTAIILNDGGKYTLVTNYHIMTNHNFLDTTIAPYMNMETNNMMVLFNGDGENKIPQLFPLISPIGERTYYIASSKTKRIIDLAFYTLNSLPENIINSTYDIKDIDTNWTITHDEKLLACGFRGDASLSLIHANVDTVSAVSYLSVPFKDPYIFAYKNFSLNGSSGGPVFKLNNGKPILIGLVSNETLTEGAFTKMPELKDFSDHRNVFEFISMSVVLREYKRLLKR